MFDWFQVWWNREYSTFEGCRWCLKALQFVGPLRTITGGISRTIKRWDGCTTAIAQDLFHPNRPALLNSFWLANCCLPLSGGKYFWDNYHMLIPLVLIRLIPKGGYHQWMDRCTFKQPRKTAHSRTECFLEIGFHWPILSLWYPNIDLIWCIPWGL
jgi:hypothetical protein